MSIIWDNLTPGIETAVASSAAEFVEALRPSNPHWWEGSSSPWVFRGHAREHWRLLPSAWRPDNSIISNCVAEAGRRFDAVLPTQSLNWFWSPNYWSGAADFGENDPQLAKRLTIATTAEYLPLWNFCATCDELGMPSLLAGMPPDPVNQPNWLASPSNPLHGDEPLNYSDVPAALALAQHHGLPTRLLDWTTAPIAAAFFAVEPLAEPIEDESLVVWALHKRRAADTTVRGINFPNAPSGAPEIRPRIVIVRPSTRDNPYLAAQAGLFTAISAAGIYFLLNDGVRPCLETFILEATPPEPVLRKLLLSHTHAQDLIEILRREKVSRAALMPTMDNVAADVRRRWLQHEALG